MANQWFKCKQFEIKQDKCGHKVGTDSFLLGAWTHIGNARQILDIGTGTGILSLMAAQRSQAEVTAIEIEKEAFEQAQENFNNSPWADRLSIQNVSLQKFSSNKKKYDVIICNPPFFQNSLISPDAKRTLARHMDILTLSDIVFYAEKNLEKGGIVSLILPIEQLSYLLDFLNANSWFAYRITKVYPKPGKKAHRTLIEFGKLKRGLELDELTIETEKRHVYTQKCYELLKEFYLKMEFENIEE